MSQDSTMKFTINLSKADIDAKLPQLKVIADGAGLTEVAQSLGALAGKPKAEMEAGLQGCLDKIGAAGDEYAYLFDQIDMLLVNLRNL
ncbi:MAG TPA: hypothetical protein VMK05_13705 [Burkholderiales bacterium]|nr:hypothetical protein [Burkholderiales bacterium]